ncbi:tubulin-specific chaperone D isoform X2 [Planococcus citri]|uniref:tubulin-specific chaperone D isoform X2 n=1 Tax=Planococcus citri TaxID=170843 RepID=UPI0031F73AF0
MDEENGNESGVKCTLEYFSESNAVHAILDNVVNVYSSENSSEVAHEKLKRVLNQYIDQPHLLDPYIEQFLNKLIGYVKNPEISLAIKQEVFRYMFLFINVRGYKVIVRLLPHEVSDLEPALQLLEQHCSSNQGLKWETRYCLLLWLSIIVMIPFDMSRLDSSDVKETTASRILECCKKGLMTTDKSRDAAAFLCAKFVSRTDIKNIYLSHIIQWTCNELITENKSLSWKKFGPLMALAAILKHGKREDLKPYTEGIFKCILTSKCLEDSYRLSRKYAIKIIQRIGLCYLRVKVAAWRYQRGSRSLALNLGINPQPETFSAVMHESKQKGDVLLEECEDIPSLVEEVVAQLLKTLRDEDITTRWSAAKGIGRVTDRLSAEFSSEIVESILTLFSPRESCCAWNGACLALAELGRRGLLLPNHIPVVVKVLLKALVYEETHGIVSAGSYVRDSACYTCWSLARAYDPETLKPYVNEIAGGLLIVASFDREMNCRKAASAAFQEHVGRQGTFPHGIDILTVADYFSVSVRKNAFLNVSSHIAKYPEYTRPMVDHLIEYKVGYWDAEIRDLTSKALHNLVKFEPAYVASKMKDILKNLYSVNLNLRHGSILSLGEIIHALANVKDQHIEFDDVAVFEIKQLVPKLQEQNMFRGVGGDLMKEACCFLIMKCSKGKFPIDDDVVACWKNLIDDCLPYENEKVRLSAASAMSALAERHYVSNNEPIDEVCKPVVDRCRAEALSHVSEAARIGYATALGILPKCILERYLNDIIGSLTKCATKTEISSKWVYSRKAAIESLTTIWKAFCVDTEDETATRELKINPVPLLETFLINLSDYTVDRRGDIGSFVRESSMKALQVVITNTCRVNKNIIPKDLIEVIVVGIAKQALDKISRIRITSSGVFMDVLYADIPKIENFEEIQKIFPKTESNTVNWTRESDTFPLFAQLMKFHRFTRPLLAAFIRCVGSVTESLARHSTSALMDYLKSKSKSELEDMCALIVDEFRTSAKDDKTTKSMFTFLERMFACGVFKPILELPENSFAMDIYELIRDETNKTKDSEKLTVSVEVLCQLLQVGGKVTKSALSTLCRFLCHRMIWFRKTVALRLTEAMMMYADVCGLSEEGEEQVMKILTEFDWENKPMEEIRATRNELCKLFDVPIPKIVVKEVVENS